MSIIFVTTKTNPRYDLAKSLNSMTDGNVELMIIVKKKNKSIFNRLKTLYRYAGARKFLKQMWYAFLLRIKKRIRLKLNYFKLYTPQEVQDKWLPKIVEVANINSEEVRLLLKTAAPDLIVLMNAPIIKQHILQTARKVINLHMGVCPQYRGSVANQFAVYRRDFSNIGATVHFVDEGVDTGDIIEIIRADITQSPKQAFYKLNDEAHKLFLQVAVTIFNKKELHPTIQHTTLGGENFMLKHWIPEVRYKTARIISEWENNNNL